jgi:hypothetical protein
VYDDGTEEPAPPDEKQYILEIHLIRNEDNAEIVAFSFPFDNTEEMYDYNLYLLYEAMANVPFTKDGFVLPEKDRWRNQWIYFRASFDYPINFYGLKEPAMLIDKEPDPNDPSKWLILPLDNRIAPYPAASVGLELHYLHWMSTEFGFTLSFSDPLSQTFVPIIQIEQKFVVKPSKHFMLEPYAVVSFPMNTSPDVEKFPMFGLGGGVQFGVKGGDTGGFFADVNFVMFMGEVQMRNSNNVYNEPDHIIYSPHYTVGFSFGYKFGFYDRPQHIKRKK